MIEMNDRGPLDLTKQIEDKDAEIKKLCMEIGSLEFQISDYRQIVKNYQTNYLSMKHSMVLYLSKVINLRLNSREKDY